MKTPMNKFLLKLYVSGRSSRSERAIANLQKIVESELPNQYELVVVDVLENPQLAEDGRILATPTLVKELPSPPRRVIGDLSDRQQVLRGLDLQPNHKEASEQEDSK